MCIKLIHEFNCTGNWKNLNESDAIEFSKAKMKI